MNSQCKIVQTCSTMIYIAMWFRRNGAWLVAPSTGPKTMENIIPERGDMKRYWFVVKQPLWKYDSLLGLIFPMLVYGKIENKMKNMRHVPNHQPVIFQNPWNVLKPSTSFMTSFKVKYSQIHSTETRAVLKSWDLARVHLSNALNLQCFRCAQFWAWLKNEVTAPLVFSFFGTCAKNN